jgi:hypothetical protein
MAKEKSLVEEAIIQMKNLEETVAENAKGILASTMKEEIKELVKESLSEQEEDEIETDVEMDMDEPEMDDEESEEMGLDMDMDTDNIEDFDTIDLTGKSDEEVLKVFELMGPEDQIMVSKDDKGNIHLKDNENGKEYMIVQEGEDDMMEDMDMEEMMNSEEEMMEDMDMEEMMNSEEEMMEDMDMDDMDMDDMDMDNIYSKVFDDEEESEGVVYEIEMDESEDDEEESEEVVYEIEMDESEDEDNDDDSEDEESEEETEGYIEEAKKVFKAKGKGMGNPSKFKYEKSPNQSGFKTKMKEAPKSVGTGKAKFEFKDGENAGSKLGKNKVVKKAETKEASRTLGSGSYFRKGGLPKKRAHSKFNMNIKENTDTQELQILREKNEEYRKALNVFRNKLNEVAVFNSNLAYATRLFTEHSTSKQEKINILRRFDGVETLKESKNLYKTIKEELSGSSVQPMNESITEKIEKAPSTGSAANLIESKTYENPQFLRMKDLMTKLK